MENGADLAYRERQNNCKNECSIDNEAKLCKLKDMHVCNMPIKTFVHNKIKIKIISKMNVVGERLILTVFFGATKSAQFYRRLVKLPVSFKDLYGYRTW